MNLHLNAHGRSGISTKWMYLCSDNVSRAYEKQMEVMLRVCGNFPSPENRQRVVDLLLKGHSKQAQQSSAAKTVLSETVLSTPALRL